MKKDFDKKKQELTEEEAIQQRIHELVFEESEQEKQELEKKLNDEANTEALNELTGVSKKKIKEITKKVRSEFAHKENNKKSKNRTFKRRNLIFIVMLLLFISQIRNFDFTFGGSESEAKEVHKAIDDANMQLLRYLILDKKYDINNGYKRQLVLGDPYISDHYVYHAMREKNLAMVLFLINNGALVAPSATTRDFLTEQVQYTKHSDLKQLIIESMVKEAGEGSAVELLFKKGYPFFRREFERAIQEGDLEALKLFKKAQRGNFDFNWQGRGLRIAIAENDTELLNLFFKQWSDYNKRTLNAAFHTAVVWSNKDAVLKLLDKGISINDGCFSTAQNKTKYRPLIVSDATALQNALYNSNAEMAKWLIDKGADINKGRFSPLSIPFRQAKSSLGFTEENYNTVKMLIDNGISVNKRDSRKRRTLYYAKKLQNTRARSKWLDKAIQLIKDNGAIE